MFVVVSLLMGLLAAGQAQPLNAVGPFVHDPHVRPLEKDADRVMANGLAKSKDASRLNGLLTDGTSATFPSADFGSAAVRVEGSFDCVKASHLRSPPSAQDDRSASQ